MSKEMDIYDSANNNLRHIFELRKRQEHVISIINRVNQKLDQTSLEKAEGFDDEFWLKLRSLYVKAKDLAEKEVIVSIDLLSQLDTIESEQTLPQQRNEVSQQKRKRIKADRDVSRLASPVVSLRTPLEHANVVVGDQVAARVTPDNADKDKWIVVKVTRYDKDATKYELIDEELGDDGKSGQRKYKLPPSSILPFPKQTDPSSTPEFLYGSQVLAVYPGTTVLRKATVGISHRKKKFDDYVLEFDEDKEDEVDELPKRLVPFYHIVPLPGGHRQ